MLGHKRSSTMYPYPLVLPSQILKKINDGIIIFILPFEECQKNYRFPEKEIVEYFINF